MWRACFHVRWNCFGALPRPPQSCYQQKQKSPACERSKQIKQERPRGRTGEQGRLLIKAHGEFGGSSRVVVVVSVCSAVELQGSGRLPLAVYWQHAGLHAEIISLYSDEDQAGLFAGILNTLSLPYKHQARHSWREAAAAGWHGWSIAADWITAFVEWFSFELLCESQ